MTLFRLYLSPHQIMLLEVISGNSSNLLWVSHCTKSTLIT